MSALLSLGLAILGVLLMLLAGLGMVRMPDLPTRMHAASKAGSRPRLHLHVDAAAVLERHA